MEANCSGGRSSPRAVAQRGRKEGLYCYTISFIFLFISARSVLKTEAISSHKSFLFIYILYSVTQAFRDVTICSYTFIVSFQ
jgi:hypothetical protein